MGFHRSSMGRATVALVTTVAFGLSSALTAQAGSDPSGVPTPGAPGLGDTVFPNLGNGGYDVQGYLLDLTYDPATRLVRSKVTLTAKATQHLSSFNLDAAGFTIHSVAVNGSASAYTASGEELTVKPAKPLWKGNAFRVSVEYTADPRLIKPPVGGYVATEDGFALAPQPSGAHSVFPSNDHPSDKAYFVFRVTAPAGTIGVASGIQLDKETHADGSTTTTFGSPHPIATEIVQVAVGDYTLVERGTSGKARLRDVVPTDRVELLEPALALTPGQLDWIYQYFGEFPLEAYGLLPVNTDDPAAFDFTGLETQTLTLYKPKYLEQSEQRIGSHMMHEIVHSWFGNSVTPSDWSALWISEGHANYYAAAYRYERGWPDDQGNVTLERRMKHVYGLGDIWRASSGPVAKPNAVNLWDNQRYSGGALVLYALREKVGAATFDRIERAYLARFRDGVAGTEDFIRTAVDVSGDPSVRPFMEEWVYGMKTPPMPNHPDWTVQPVPITPMSDRSPLQTDRRDG